jgi:hypothetical protein
MKSLRIETQRNSNRRLSAAIILVVLASLPRASEAEVVLTSAGGYEFDIQDTSSGNVMDGTSDAYDGCYTLRINGTAYSSGGAAAIVDGRNVQMATVTVGGSFSISRNAHVPESGGDYIRYFDVIENTGAATTVDVEYYCNFGSDSSTTVWGTSSGDTVADTSDFWFGTDDADGSGDPTLAHSYFGEGAVYTPATQTVSGDESTVSFSIPIGAGEIVAFLVFGFQGPNRATLQPAIEELVLDVPGATSDMDGGDLSLVVNYGLGEAPLIRWAPEQLFEVPEGGELLLEVSIEDREGDPTTTSWDLDGDEEYDDGDEESAVFSAAGLDGPTTVNIGVMAADDQGNVSQRRVDVSVTNSPPVVTNIPEEPLEVLIGEELTFTPEVVDPGGDEITIDVVDRPAGMVILADGGVRWVPNDLQVGLTSVTFFVYDDDDDPTVEGDGDASFVLEINVSENLAPGMPTIVSPDRNEEVDTLRPTLVIANPPDPEDDLLSIIFEVDSSDTFPAPIASGPIRADSSGETSWVVSEELVDGARYYWRVWAFDGDLEGPRASSSFLVRLGESDGDADADADGDGDGDSDGDLGPPTVEGCNCYAGGASTGSSASWLILSLALGLIFRRLRFL